MSARDEDRFQELRGAVRREVDGSSLRAVARSIGLSPSGLQKFLDGAEPYRPTRAKLRHWYLGTQSAPTTAAEAEASLQVLLKGVPPGERGEVRRRVLDAVREMHVAAGRPPPLWLAGLEEERDTKRPRTG